jgi:transcriptional regulator with XRE-family HTH domain
MPAASLSSAVVGVGICDMPPCSHITNNRASAFVRTERNDSAFRFSHNRNMARRGIPTQINWYLKEWMDLLGVIQAEMCRRTDWSKATMSQLYNNKQDYSPDLVNTAAEALNLEPFELLMRPERAMAFRRQREAALVLAHDADAIEKDAATG